MRIRPYLKPWKSSGLEESRLASAVALISFATTDTTVTPEHRTRVIKDLLWSITEDDGKYATRYRSAGVINLERDGLITNWRSQLVHEHVVTRKELRQRLDAGEDIKSVLRDARGCVITKDEHTRLSVFDATHHGWDRYRAAKISVIDMLDGSKFI